jgi:hypothetical protein
MSLEETIWSTGVEIWVEGRSIASSLREADIDECTVVNALVQGRHNQTLVIRPRIADIALNQKCLAQRYVNSIICGWTTRQGW